MKEEIRNQIYELLRETIDDDSVEIRDDSDIVNDLELSSLEVMTCIADMEKAFHVRFKEKELMGIVTVDDLAECVMKKLA